MPGDNEPELATSKQTDFISKFLLMGTYISLLIYRSFNATYLNFENMKLRKSFTNVNMRFLYMIK